MPAPAELARIIKFGIVGGLASGIYAIATYLFIVELAMNETLASFTGYLIAIPVSFLGQKYLTFNSRGDVRQEVLWYTLVQGMNLIIATVIAWLFIDLTGWNPLIGIMLVITAIPAISYVLMSLKVFPERNRTK